MRTALAQIGADPSAHAGGFALWLLLLAAWGVLLMVSISVVAFAWDRRRTPAGKALTMAGASLAALLVALALWALIV